MILAFFRWLRDIERVLAAILRALRPDAQSAPMPPAQGSPPTPPQVDDGTCPFKGVRRFSLLSTAFADGGVLPRTYASVKDGAGNASPPLVWVCPPENTVAFALRVVDATNALVHWLAWNIPAALTTDPDGTVWGSLAEGAGSSNAMPPGSVEGEQQCATDSAGNLVIGWEGPGPGDLPGEHVYVFVLYALSKHRPHGDAVPGRKPRPRRHVRRPRRRGIAA